MVHRSYFWYFALFRWEDNESSHVAGRDDDVDSLEGVEDEESESEDEESESEDAWPIGKSMDLLRANLALEKTWCINFINQEPWDFLMGNVINNMLFR